MVITRANCGLIADDEWNQFRRCCRQTVQVVMLVGGGSDADFIDVAAQSDL